MSNENKVIDQFVGQEYKWGFYTDLETDTLPPGLDEEVVRHISARKEEPEWLLEWRLKAFRHWQAQEEPCWPQVKYEPIDYQAISYYSAPGSKDKDRPKSLDEAREVLLIFIPSSLVD